MIIGIASEHYDIVVVQELVATPAGLISLNDECRPTNTAPGSPKPYDHVMYNKAFTTEIDEAYDLVVIDLVESMKPFWNSSESLPWRSLRSQQIPAVLFGSSGCVSDGGVAMMIERCWF